MDALTPKFELASLPTEGKQSSLHSLPAQLVLPPLAQLKTGCYC